MGSNNKQSNDMEVPNLISVTAIGIKCESEVQDTFFYIMCAKSVRAIVLL